MDGIGVIDRIAVLEREHELAAIDAAFARVAEGEGNAVLIEGPMGIGKSRLLAEAGAIARRHGLEVLSARGGELERDYPFGVVLQLFEQRIASAPPDEREQLLRGRAAPVASLLAGAPADEGPASAADEFAMLHALYWLVVNLAEQQPLVLLLDDVHWADDLSLRSLLYVAERVADLSVGGVAAVRTPLRRAGGELLTRVLDTAGMTALKPAELSLEATHRLLAEAGLPAADDEDVVRACWTATGGSPLLLRELLVAMRDEPSAHDRPYPTRVATLAPRTLERRILPRITAIGSEALGVARVAAVLGDDARLALAARIAGHDFDAAVRATEGLLDAAIIAQADPVEFAHPMMRTVIYGSIPPGERLRLHAAAARELRSGGARDEQVAHHLMSGSPVDEPWVAGTFHSAARAAASRGSPSIAVDYLRRAVEHAPSPAERASMLVDLGLLEAATGETTSLTRFEAALDALEDPAERARALYALGQTQYRYGRHDDSARTFRRGADMFTSEDPEAALRFEAAWACAATWLTARHGDVADRLAELASTISDGGAPTAAERSVLAVHSAYCALATPPARGQAALARRALADGVLLAEHTSASPPLFLAIFALMLTGEIAEAERAIDAVLDDARRRDDGLAFAEASAVRAHVTFAHGRIGEAAADAEAAIGGVALGWRAAVVLPYAVLALCEIERGDLDRAEATLEEALAHATAGMAASSMIFAARARLRLLRGDLQGALADCWANRDTVAAAGFTNPSVALWRPLACVALARSGDEDGARALIEEELDVARRYGLPVHEGIALRVRAALQPDADALRDLRAALELHTAREAPLERARTLVDLGPRLHAAGDLDAGRDALREAMSLAHDCRATALEAQARDALVAAGGRPRRPSISGIAALTASERRIAELAAGGTTNREIAETLFVTKNTVEWHLRNVFKKLGVRSRAELRELLERDA